MELADRLKVFQAAGLLGQVWQDRMLEPGELWESSILRELDRADVVVLLVSNAALASSFIREKEMAAAFARHRAGTAIVVPVILERCSWEVFPELKQLQALPKDAKPLREWKPSRNVGWHNVTEGLRTKFAALQQARGR